MELDRQQVRELRQGRGWTQQQLAEVAGLSLRTVQRVESLGVGSHETVAALCAVFEVPRERLLAQAPTAPQPAAAPVPLAVQLPLTLAAGMALGSTLTLLALRLLG
ncbi:MAG TPA: helix-turn-helix transcriptional regulator [Vicinamibacterales bacterium]|nr:helix-turn-helix transcriptional regulator [Vicinamibacterales bacterium]